MENLDGGPEFGKYKRVQLGIGPSLASISMTETRPKVRRDLSLNPLRHDGQDLIVRVPPGTRVTWRLEVENEAAVPSPFLLIEHRLPPALGRPARHRTPCRSETG